jgi:hypothetical protein
LCGLLDGGNRGFRDDGSSWIRSARPLCFGNLETSTARVYYSERNEPSTADIKSYQPRVTIHRPIIKSPYPFPTKQRLQGYHNCTWFLHRFLNEAQIKWQLPFHSTVCREADSSAKPKCRAILCKGQRLESRETRTIDCFPLHPNEL